MNAVNPLQSPLSGNEQRPYEPSMEEILASIRRIIADDQSVPAPNPSPPRAETRAEPAVEPLKIVQISATPTDAVSVSSITVLDRPPIAPDVPSVSGMKPHVPLAALKLPMADFSKPQSPASEPMAAQPVSLQRPSIVSSHPVDPATFAPAPIGDVARGAAAPPPVNEDVAASDPYFDPPIERDEPASSPEVRAALFSTQTHQSVSSAFNTLAATRLAANSDELLGLVREMIRPLLKTWLDDNLPSMVERMVRAEIERVARGR